jgi:hypothetical protein
MRWLVNSNCDRCDSPAAPNHMSQETNSRHFETGNSKAQPFSKCSVCRNGSAPARLKACNPLNLGRLFVTLPAQQTSQSSCNTKKVISSQPWPYCKSTLRRPTASNSPCLRAYLLIMSLSRALARPSCPSTPRALCQTCSPPWRAEGCLC